MIIKQHNIILIAITCAIVAPLGSSTTYELLTTNYASAFLGAKIADHHPAAKGVHNILNDNKEKYMNIPCSADRKRFTIQLAKEIQLNMFSVSNLEYFSSSLKHFTLLGSRTYPCVSPCKWRVLGNYKAKLTRSQQSFLVPKQSVIRYVRLLWVSRYSREKSCTLTSFQAYGTDVIENLAAELAGDGEVIRDTGSVTATDVLSQHINGIPVSEGTSIDDVIELFPGRSGGSTDGFGIDESGSVNYSTTPFQNMSQKNMTDPSVRPMYDTGSNNTYLQHYINITKIIRLQNVEYPSVTEYHNTSSLQCMKDYPNKDHMYYGGPMCTIVRAVQRVPVTPNAVRPVPIMRSQLPLEPELMPLLLVKHIKMLQYTVAALSAQNATTKRHIKYIMQEINLLKEQITREKMQCVSAIDAAVVVANRKYDLMTTQTQLQLLELQETMSLKYANIVIWSYISLVVALSALFCVTLQSRAAIPAGHVFTHGGNVDGSHWRKDSLLDMLSPHNTDSTDNSARSLDEINHRREVSDDPELSLESPTDTHTPDQYTHDVKGSDYVDN